jgi:hypothetical protein
MRSANVEVVAAVVPERAGAGGTLPPPPPQLASRQAVDTSASARNLNDVVTAAGRS